MGSMGKKDAGMAISSLKTAMTGMLPKGSIPDSEIDAITQLCVMGMIPEGDEDPKQILQRVSDRTLGRVAAGIKSFAKNPVIGRVAQFFIVEWGVRAGHVAEWRWTWDSPSEGRMSYRPSRPMSELVELAVSSAVI